MTIWVEFISGRNLHDVCIGYGLFAYDVLIPSKLSAILCEVAFGVITLALVD